jgi:hypothetical protein
MKRYLLFAIPDVRASGGWYDFREASDDISDLAITHDQAASEFPILHFIAPDAERHIVDAKTMEIVGVSYAGGKWTGKMFE